MGTVRVRWCRDAELLRPGRLARHLGAGRRRARQPGEPPRRPARVDDGRRRERCSRRATTALVDIEAEDTAVVDAASSATARSASSRRRPRRGRRTSKARSRCSARSGAVVIGGFAVNEMQTWNFAEPLPGDDEVMAEVLGQPAERLRLRPPGVLRARRRLHPATSKRQLVDGLEGRRSLELISAIYESIETGREVQLRFAPKLCRLGSAHARAARAGTSDTPEYASRRRRRRRSASGVTRRRAGQPLRLHDRRRLLRRAVRRDPARRQRSARARASSRTLSSASW